MDGGQEPGGRALMVSLHDVSPLTRDVFTAMLAELRELGVGRCSLLVIPDHHGRGKVVDDAGCCRWLERLAWEGHELVLHGYHHQRTARSAETWRERFMTRVYTNGEGEFYDLSQAEAAELLARGKAELARLDAPEPTGFIAPAWLLSDPANAAVRAAGFRYTTYLTGVRDYRAAGEGFILARSLVYSPRNRWRRVVSLAYIGALAKALRKAPLLRLGLHPPDFQHKNLWRQVRRIVAEAVRDRRVMTYGEFFGQRH